ncbi:DUF711 family protein [Candidatus Microgenomates bacterium]|nr:DUF711 family protein [Candidatus Microgenomates bacterium]
MTNKIIRSLCYFTKNPSAGTVKAVDELAKLFKDQDYEIQTKRICSTNKKKIKELDLRYGNEYTLSLGSLTKEEITANFDTLFDNVNTHFNLDLTSSRIDLSHVQILFGLIKKRPEKTFNFTFVFNNQPSAPFFPAASYQQEGFSLGLQSTDLSLGCNSSEKWLERTRTVWKEIMKLLRNRTDFLGIDSSVAPLVTPEGSFIGFIKRLGMNFSQSTTTDFYLKITSYIKSQNLKPVGLCGLMFPCLEDAELAREYEAGNFSLERNLYLSLHCGLGIDTYPIGIDEEQNKVLEILNVIQGLSNKYHKPLSCRFVSDGKTKIGGKTDFKNQYLQDVLLRSIK